MMSDNCGKKVYEYADGWLGVRLLGSDVGEFTSVKTVKDALRIIREDKVKPQFKHVVAQLALGVELHSLQPHPNPMNSKWLSDFITTKVDNIKSVCPEDRLFQDYMDTFCTKMLGHTMTMNTASAMKSKILQAIDQIATNAESHTF